MKVGAVFAHLIYQKDIPQISHGSQRENASEGSSNFWSLLDWIFFNLLPEAVGHLQSFIYLPYLILYLILKFWGEESGNVV